MIGGTGEIINRSAITQSDGRAIRVAVADPNNPGSITGYWYPLEAEWSYTSIGACAGGRLVFATAVGGIPYLYLLRIQVYNSGSWETVFLCTHQDSVQSGDVFTMELVSLWDVIRNDFIDVATTPIYPRIGYVVQGGRIYGGKNHSQIQLTYGMTWEQYYNAKYEGVDDAQWGYGVDGYFIAGEPSAFTAATYTKDKNTLEEDDQGYSELDYLTAYKGINIDLNSDAEVSDSRNLGLLVPRQTQVISWDSAFADTTYNYTWTRTFPTESEVIYTSELAENDGYWEIRLGSDDPDLLPAQAIGTRVQFNTNKALLTYDDIPYISVAIKFTGTAEYGPTSTFVFNSWGTIGRYKLDPPYIRPQAYGMNWEKTKYQDQNYEEYEYPIVYPPSIVGSFLQRSFFNFVGNYAEITDVTGLKWEGDLEAIKQIYQTQSGGWDMYELDNIIDNPIYILNFGVGFGLDRLGAAGDGMTVEIAVSVTLRNNANGWIVPPEFASAAYAGPTYRLLLNGLYAPPMTISGSYVAGATVRASAEQGVTTEVLTGILPAGRRR